MFRITDYASSGNFRNFQNDEMLFHKAAEFVKKGEKRFHVSNENGDDFDIVYYRNQEWARAQEGYNHSVVFNDFDLYPSYEDYDEKDPDRLCLDIFEDFDAVFFEELCEYSIVLANVILNFTGKKAVFSDERIYWFIKEQDRLKIARDLPEGKSLIVSKEYHPCGISQDFSRMDPILVFHQVFVFQWMTDRPLCNIRYAAITVPKSEGIGSVLLSYALASDFFEKHGIKAVLQPGTSRYSDEMLKRYLDVSFVPDDADESNTISLINFFSFYFLYCMRGRYCRRVRKLLSAGFLSEIKEYRDAVFGGKKVLGLLIRGSDYITTGMSNEMKPPLLEEIIPIVRSWLEKDKYDCIFLATEDRDVLSRMRSEFGGKLLAVSQERYSVSDLGDQMTISEYDSEEYKGDDYERHLDDLTANYLYAMVILSSCDSFIYSCRCIGSSLARQLMTVPFEKSLCVAEMKGADN